MKREIKFKGKAKMSIEELNELGLKHENGWVYGHLVMYGKTPYIVGDFIEVDSEYTVNEFWVEVIPDTVGQFTGLDKNGKEIYEGDIVLVNRYDLLTTSWNSEIENEKKILIMSRVGYVVYDELRLSFRVKSPIGNQTIALSGVGYFDYDIEVIGNIYEKEVKE